MGVKICGFDLKNPVIASAGTFRFGKEFEEYFPIELLGAITTPCLTLNKKEGNKGIRIHESSSGLMNSIGRQNPGINGFIENELTFLKEKTHIIIANIGGSSISDYLEGILLLNESSVDMIEINLSCKNIFDNGNEFGIKSNIAKELVGEAKKLSKKPIIVKLSPNAENIIEMGFACAEAGADVLSLVNTFNALAIDIYKRKSIFNNLTGGLSGPGIKPIALRMVREVSQVVDIPIIGIGGIFSWQDAIEFIMAGAWAIGIGTANFIKPDITLDIIKGIEDFVLKEGIKDLEEIRGII